MSQPSPASSLRCRLSAVGVCLLFCLALCLHAAAGTTRAAPTATVCLLLSCTSLPEAWMREVRLKRLPFLLIM